MLPDRITLKSGALYVLMITVMLAGAVSPISGQRRQKQPSKYVLPQDSILHLRINKKLSSKKAQVNETFASTVVTPVYVRGVEVIPAGSLVTGHVTQVERAGRKGKEGSINVIFTSIKIPNGKQYPIDAVLAASDEVDNEGGIKGKSSRKRNARFIGRGMVVGGLINGGSGVVSGGVMGAARGLIKKGEEAEINSGTEFDIILNRSVSMYAFR